PAASIASGQRLIVWLDGEPAESTANEFHASFRLSPVGGSIALIGMQRGLPAVFDYLSFDQVPAGQSLGAFPEGQAVRRETFFKSTPGTINDLSAPPVQVTINEWMATNSRTIQDPDDLDFDDWFELYNAGTESVDLGGYSLTDNLNNPSQFRIPNGTIIPARGFLLVWADGENATNGDLHVNFRLSADGENLGLFAPDGSVIDSISFQAQTADVSEGRIRDGGSQFGVLTTATPGQSNTGIDPNALQFTSVTAAQGQTTLNWNTQPGKVYAIEYKNSLSDPAWTRLGTFNATGSSGVMSDPINGRARFYRVVQQP
ncbi:MAG TPA: lamin tail domain-containing protein, partial [Verrucomicrobiae bacterium]|nr:lamin tail domain-containing protein [Verrucomicrobiae bacterium]